MDTGHLYNNHLVWISVSLYEVYSIDDANWGMYCVSNLYHMCTDSTPLFNPLYKGSKEVISQWVHNHSPSTASIASTPSTPSTPSLLWHTEEIPVTIKTSLRRKQLSRNRNLIGGSVEMLKGVTELKRYLFQFSASADGISIFKNSLYNNSVDAFTMYSENMLRRHMGSSLDAFCVISSIQ